MRLKKLDIACIGWILGAALLFPPSASAGPGDCPAEDNHCFTYCPSNQVWSCGQLHPGCVVTQAWCCAWNITCWGEWDDYVQCRYQTS